jgi:flagellar motor protein MotB
VTVVGHTSDTAPVAGGPYADNAAVGLARALAAAVVVADGATLPLSAVDVATSGDVAPPYPNTDAANRTRNQTVTLRIEVVEAPRG